MRPDDARRRRSCPVRVLLDDLAPEPRAALESALAGRAGIARIARAVRAQGLAIGEASLRAHRYAECHCAVTERGGLR